MAPIRGAKDFAEAGRLLWSAVQTVSRHAPPEALAAYERGFNPHPFNTFARADRYNPATEALLLDYVRRALVVASGTIAFHAGHAWQAARLKARIETARTSQPSEDSPLGKDLLFLQGLDIDPDPPYSPFMTSLLGAARFANYPGHVYLLIGEMSREELIPRFRDSRNFSVATNLLIEQPFFDPAALRRSLETTLKDITRAISEEQERATHAQSELDCLVNVPNMYVYPHVRARDMAEGAVAVYTAEKAHYQMLLGLLEAAGA